MLSSIKNELRKKIGFLSRSVLQQNRESQSRIINVQLLDSIEWKTSETVGLFLPINGEPDITPLIHAAMAQGKRVLLPRVLGSKSNEMTMLYLEEIEELDLFPSSKYGVKEPPLEVVSGIRKGLKRFAWDDIDVTNVTKKDLLVQPDYAQERDRTFNIDLLVVPGVAFDTNCNRLGHGKGYYDSFIFRNKSLQQQLSKTKRSTFIVGVALTEQMIDNVPHDERDMKLDAVINPSGFIRCTSCSY